MLKALCVFMLLGISGSVTAANYPDTNPSATASAVLYYHPECHHCKKVMSYLSQTNKTLPMKNTNNPKYKDELRRRGQKGVPALVLGSRVIVGSGPIISYLDQHPEILR